MSKATDIRDKLADKGRIVVLRPYSVGSGRYNPSLGEITPVGVDGAKDGNRYALLLDQMTNNPARGWGHENQVDTLVEGVKKWALMDAVGSTPKMQDHVIDGLIDYNILKVLTIDEGGVPVLHTLALGI